MFFWAQPGYYGTLSTQSLSNGMDTHRVRVLRPDYSQVTVTKGGTTLEHEEKSRKSRCHCDRALDFRLHQDKEPLLREAMVLSGLTSTVFCCALQSIEPAADTHPVLGHNSEESQPSPVCALEELALGGNFQRQHSELLSGQKG